MKKLFTVLVVLVAMVVFVGLSGCTNSAKGPKVVLFNWQSMLH